MYLSFVIPSHTPISPPHRTYGNISTWGLETEKWFFFFSPTACHRWWESLCNANIISHCVGLALQFALCAKQPGCGVIYQYVEKKTSLGLHWMAAWLAGPAARPAATGPAFTLLIPWSVQCCVLLINSTSECLSHCVCLLKMILLREPRLLKAAGRMKWSDFRKPRQRSDVFRKRKQIS